ncbi:hypothetical protein [Melissococcus plutonius]|uniref:hypothetical protein n=1 Tax=Melissococcus plutonius TaxID=33970 RepID=UPI003C2E005A
MKKRATNTFSCTFNNQILTFYEECLNVLLLKKENTFSLLDYALSLNCSNISFILDEKIFSLFIINRKFFHREFDTKKRTKKYLNKALELLQLNENILTYSYEQLDFYLRIKVQLMRSLFVDKKLIVIDNIFAKLTTEQIQELFLLLKILTKKKQYTIILLTTNQKIAKVNDIGNNLNFITD